METVIGEASVPGEPSHKKGAGQRRRQLGALDLLGEGTLGNTANRSLLKQGEAREKQPPPPDLGLWALGF